MRIEPVFLTKFLHLAVAKAGRFVRRSVSRSEEVTDSAAECTRIELRRGGLLIAGGYSIGPHGGVPVRMLSPAPNRGGLAPFTGQCPRQGRGPYVAHPRGEVVKFFLELGEGTNTVGLFKTVRTLRVRRTRPSRTSRLVPWAPDERRGSGRAHRDLAGVK